MLKCEITAITDLTLINIYTQYKSSVTTYTRRAFYYLLCCYLMEEFEYLPSAAHHSVLLCAFHSTTVVTDLLRTGCKYRSLRCQSDVTSKLIFWCGKVCCVTLQQLKKLLPCNNRRAPSEIIQDDHLTLLNANPVEC